MVPRGFNPLGESRSRVRTAEVVVTDVASLNDELLAQFSKTSPTLYSVVQLRRSRCQSSVGDSLLARIESLTRIIGVTPTLRLSPRMKAREEYRRSRN